MVLAALLLLSQLVQTHRPPPTLPPGFPSVEYRAVYAHVSQLHQNPLVDQDAQPLTMEACQELIDAAPANNVLWKNEKCYSVQTWRPTLPLCQPETRLCYQGQ